MKQKLLLCVVLMCWTSVVSAQEYGWAVGARFGGQTSGITAKYNVSAANSIEGVLTIPYNGGFSVLAMYERNIPVIAEGFNFYYGAGAHIGSWSKKHYSKFVLGIDAIAGLEYNIKSIPLAVSIDYKPALNIVGHQGFYLGDIALGVKVTF